MMRRNASLHLKILLPIDTYHTSKAPPAFFFFEAVFFFFLLKKHFFLTKHSFQFSDGLVKVSVY